ncbi:hypothetical protein [Thalassobacillus pellis]|uniref:hypothetical protein n=1 Tax=Thalassobacillus pellis TaxID=748008 RepID=UPI001960D091|nr:hypothetical protein [Thalassobacillus pellis]MBM7554518.1 hypothetical protein [Thalassobacillus pellis]
MSRITLLLLTFLVLVVCPPSYAKSFGLIHYELREDVNHMLSILDEAHAEKRPLQKGERALFDHFQATYQAGNFLDANGEKYRMNDLEQALVYHLAIMQRFTAPASSKATRGDPYEQERNIFFSHYQAEEIPEEIKGMYPNYEIHRGLHPRLQADALQVVREVDALVRAGRISLVGKSLPAFHDFLSVYQNGKIQAGGSVYLMNKEGIPSTVRL